MDYRVKASEHTPVYDVLALQVVERQRHLAQVELHSVLGELHALLQMIAQISS